MDLTRYADAYWAAKDDRVDEARLRRLIAHVPRGARVLVVDGGPGMLAALLRAAGHEVAMTDLSGHAVERARAKGLDARQVDTDDAPLPFDDASFDCVISDSAIEHRYFPAHAVREGARVLRPGGTFLLLVPNIAHWRDRLWLLFGRWPEVVDGPTDASHIRNFALPSARALMRAHGLEPHRVDGSASLWVKGLYPRAFRLPLVRSFYEALARLRPSLFARDLILVCTKRGRSETSS